MKPLYSFTIFLSIFSSSFAADYDEYINHKNIPTVVNQVVNGFFGSRYYAEKDACLRSALYEAEKKCQTPFGYPRQCLKEKALERILGNIKTKSMELARRYVASHPYSDRIIEAIGRKVQNKLKDIIGYDNRNYVNAFEAFITDYSLPAYSFEDKIRCMVEQEKSPYTTPQITCCSAFCDAKPSALVRLPCGHHMCSFHLLGWNEVQKEQGKVFRCPKCSTAISTNQLEQLLNNYWSK